MATFPTSLPSNTDPIASNKLSSPSHSALHQSHNGEIVAVETKVGTGASTPTNNTFLIGNGAGTSAWSALTSAQLAARVSDETGTGSLVLGTSPSITTPSITTSINDANGNEVIKTPATGSATNEITVTNAANGSAPLISATGSSDSNVNLNMQPKGSTGIVQVLDGNGNEVIKAGVATASAVNEVTITNAATGNSPVIAASGTDATANLNLRGKGLAKTVNIGAGAVNIFPYDYVASGCVWTADSVGVNLNASMTAGVVVINGNPITVAAVTARAFTTNVDTYMDVLDNGDGTGLVVYTTAVTNAASAALASNSVRTGIIQAAATITATTKVNQGQEDRVFPIASSIPYAVTDSLGNLICPRDPNRKIIGYRQIITSITSTTSSTFQDATGLSAPVIIPTGRKTRVVFLSSATNSSGATGITSLAIDEDGTVIQQTFFNKASGNSNMQQPMFIQKTPSAGSHTYKIRFSGDSTNTTTIAAGAAGASVFTPGPASITVELV